MLSKLLTGMLLCTHTHTYIYTHIYIVSRRSITPQHIKYNSKSLDIAQSLYFGSKLPSSGTYYYHYYYMYVPDEGSLLPKHGDCATSNDFELYTYIYIYNNNTILYIYIYIVGKTRIFRENKVLNIVNVE